MPDRAGAKERVAEKCCSSQNAKIKISSMWSHQRANVEQGMKEKEVGEGEEASPLSPFYQWQVQRALKVSPWALGALHCRMCCAPDVLSAWVGLLAAYNGRNILYQIRRAI